jgi:prephenate dehydrogenase
MFDKVTIIGLGLIGSSMARAIRASGIANTVTAADISGSLQKSYRSTNCR